MERATLLRLTLGNDQIRCSHKRHPAERVVSTDGIAPDKSGRSRWYRCPCTLGS